MTQRLGTAVLCFAAAALAPPLPALPAAAGSFSVSPVRVHLDPSGRAQTIQLRNEGAKPVMVQVQAFEWLDRPVPDELAPSHDLLAAPPVFEFGPGETQVIRLALRRPAAGGGGEQAYRLVITEVPYEAEANNGVAFAVRLNLPVFVTPPGAAPAPVWTALRRSDGGGELRLINQGTAHLHLRRLRLAADGGGQPLFESEEADRVLAGRERVWRFDAGRLPASAPLRITAGTDAGELDAVVPLQGG